MAERDRGGYAPAVLGHHPRHLGARRVRPGRAPRGYRPASYLHRVGALINHHDPATRDRRATTGQKSNQVNIGAFRGSCLEPAPRSSRTKPPDVVVGSLPIPTAGRDGWRGRIRTFDLLIQSQAPYRLATRQCVNAARAAACGDRVYPGCPAALNRRDRVPGATL
jgi:hypothetical protein